MRCHYHAEEEAIGACAMCGHPLCETCTVERDRVFYCESCLAEKEGTGENRAPASDIPKIKLPAGEYYQPPRADAGKDPAPKSKRPGTAALLSIFIPFTGQIYNNQFAKALTFLLLFISCIILAQKSHPMEGLFGVIAAFIYFYQIYDAYKTARGIKGNRTLHGPGPHAHRESHAECTPRAPNPLPALAAPAVESPIWGISLILLGVVFLLDNFNLIHYSTLISSLAAVRHRHRDGDDPDLRSPQNQLNSRQRTSGLGGRTGNATAVHEKPRGRQGPRGFIAHTHHNNEIGGYGTTTSTLSDFMSTGTPSMSIQPVRL